MQPERKDRIPNERESNSQIPDFFNKTVEYLQSAGKKITVNLEFYTQWNFFKDKDKIKANKQTKKTRVFHKQTLRELPSAAHFRKKENNPRKMV